MFSGLERSFLNSVSLSSSIAMLARSLAMCVLESIRASEDQDSIRSMGSYISCTSPQTNAGGTDASVSSLHQRMTPPSNCLCLCVRQIAGLQTMDEDAGGEVESFIEFHLRDQEETVQQQADRPAAAQKQQALMREETAELVSEHAATRHEDASPTAAAESESQDESAQRLHGPLAVMQDVSSSTSRKGPSGERLSPIVGNPSLRMRLAAGGMEGSSGPTSNLGYSQSPSTAPDSRLPKRSKDAQRSGGAADTDSPMASARSSRHKRDAENRLDERRLDAAAAFAASALLRGTVQCSTGSASSVGCGAYPLGNLSRLGDVGIQPICNSNEDEASVLGGMLKPLDGFEADLQGASPVIALESSLPASKFGSAI